MNHTQNFHDRIDKITAIHAAEGRKIRMSADFGSKRPIRAKKGKRSPFRDLLYVPTIFLLGAVIALAGRLITYHYITDNFSFGLISFGIDTQALSLVLSAFVGFLFIVHKAFMMFVSHILGSSLIVFKETALLVKYPEIWANLYSPMYVNKTLFHLNGSLPF